MANDATKIGKLILESGYLSEPTASTIATTLPTASTTTITLAGYISEAGAKFNPGKTYEKIKFGNSAGHLLLLDNQEPHIEFTAIEGVLDLFQNLLKHTGNSDAPNPTQLQFNGVVKDGAKKRMLSGFVRVNGEKLELAMQQSKHAELPVTLDFIPDSESVLYILGPADASDTTTATVKYK